MRRVAAAGRWMARLLLVAVTCLAAGPALPRSGTVDAAIVLAVDVSGSVDAERYALQMQGIARTFEDPAVQQAMLGGSHGAVDVALVEWSNKPRLTVPWRRVASAADAAALAQDIRRAVRSAEDFTCMAAALQMIEDKLLPFVPSNAERMVVDVSGDGSDNCNPAKPVAAVRDELVVQGVTVNGLPILEGREADTLFAWYHDNVVGGPAAFVLPAAGYGDFARAMRRKFVVEISRAGP